MERAIRFMTLPREILKYQKNNYMAKTDLHGAIEYARKNPKSDFARQLKTKITSGELDGIARQQGVDLSWAGRKALEGDSYEAPAEEVEESLGDQAAKRGDAVVKSVTDVGDEFNAGRPLEAGLKAAQVPLRAIGQVAGFAGDVIGAGLKPVLEKTGLAEPLGNAVTAVAESPVGKGAKSVWDTLPTDVQKPLGDAANVASFIAPVGPAAKVASKIPKAVDAGVSAINTAEKAVVGTTAKVAGAPGKVVTNMLKQEPKQTVQTALTESSMADVDRYANIARKSVSSGKNQTPLEHAGVRAQEALDQMNRKLSNIGSTKRKVLEQAAVGNKPVGSIAVKFRQTLQNLSGVGLVEGDTKLIHTVMQKAKELGKNPTAKQVDKFIDNVQNEVYTAKRNLTIPVSDSGTAPIKRALGELNNNLKSQLPDSYKTLNKKYAEMVEDFNELNLKLGAEGEKGGALMKRVFSPSDNNTKQLFARIKKETGIDLVNEATLARYMMEVFKDTRGASMLEQLGLKSTDVSIGGLLGKGVDALKNKVNSPDSLIKRAREMTKDYPRAQSQQASAKSAASSQSTKIAPTMANTSPMTSTIAEGTGKVNTVQKYFKQNPPSLGLALKKVADPAKVAKDLTPENVKAIRSYIDLSEGKIRAGDADDLAISSRFDDFLENDGIDPALFKDEAAKIEYARDLMGHYEGNIADDLLKEVQPRDRQGRFVETR